MAAPDQVSEDDVAKLAGSQPQVLGTPMSQPVISGIQVLHDRIRRRQSTRAEPQDRGSSNPQVMSQMGLQQSRNDIFVEIRNRLHQKQVSTTIIDRSLLAFLLPKDGANIDIWNSLMECPMRVSDADLEQIITLRKVTSKTPAPPRGHVIFYIRSFAFEVHELRSVLEDLSSRGVMISKANMWHTIMNSLPTNASLFLRYCGCTTKSAWARNYDDIVSARNSEFSHIIQTTLLLFPEIIENVMIYELTKGTVPLSITGTTEIQDAREQSLIALMGHETLLNTQVGGKQISSDHSLELDNEISALRLTTVHRLQTQTVPASKQIRHGIETYTMTVQQWANEHPISTGTNVNSFTDEYRNVVFNQAVPRLVKDTEYTPLLMIGHDPTISSFRNAEAFHESESFARDLIKSVINTFVRIETGISDMTSAARLFNENYLPFVDLFPWCKKSASDANAAMSALQSYMQITSPLVVVTWGEEVSSVALGNFQHRNGIRHGELARHVGVPTISYYSASVNKSSHTSNGDSCCVVIPSYHPSAGSYGSLDPQTFVEVFVRTMTVAWTATFYALKLLQTRSFGDKKELLVSIIDATKAFTSDNSTITKGLRKAMEDLKSKSRRGTVAAKHKSLTSGGGRGSVQANVRDSDRSWGTAIARKPYNELRLAIEGSDIDTLEAIKLWTAAKEEVKMIMRCGWALFAPGSVERNNQAKQLWRLHLGVLFTDKTGTEEKKFRQWAEKVNEGDLFYFAATTTDDQMLDVPNLLTVHASNDVDKKDSTWMQDGDALTQASESMQKWFEEKVVQKSTSSENAELRGIESLAALMYLKAPDLRVVQRLMMKHEVGTSTKKFSDPVVTVNGAEVDVIAWRNDKSSAALVLEWADNSGYMHKLSGHSHDNAELCLPPSCMKAFIEDKRFINFTSDGIDITDQTGASLKHQGTTCTVPLQQIRLMLKGLKRDKFLELWSRETGLSVEDEIHAADTTGDNSLAQVPGGFYPAAEFTGSRRKNLELTVGSRGHTINEKTEIAKIKKSLPLQAGDALWLIHKFLEVEYPGGGLCDASNPAVFANADSCWVRLKNFVDRPMYKYHPMRQHIKDVCDTALEPRNTAGCDMALKIAFVDFLRPGSTKARKQVWNPATKKKPWKVTYNLSTNQPSSSVLPSYVNPQLEHDEVLQTVIDNKLVGADGELLPEDQQPQVDIDDDLPWGMSHDGTPPVKGKGKGKAMETPQPQSSEIQVSRTPPDVLVPRSPELPAVHVPTTASTSASHLKRKHDDSEEDWTDEDSDNVEPEGGSSKRRKLPRAAKKG